MDDFFKFPSTIHLAFLGDDKVRSDKCMSIPEREEFLQHEIIVEEKVDGANLGISFDENGNIICQNRGHRLVEPFDGQWRPLRRWLTERADVLFDVLSSRLMIFGEWCYAKHSVAYDELPDWFLLFDVYDKVEGRFYSVRRRNEIARTLGLSTVRQVAAGRYGFDALREMTFVSFFGHETAEGVYFRLDGGDWLEQRSKLVRPAFRQAIDSHWSRRGIIPNRIIVQGCM